MDPVPVEKENPPPPMASGVLGRDEMNFAEFPLALLTDRAPSDQKTLEADDQIYDERKGQLVSRRLTITASDKYGLTTPKDEDVLLGLIQLTKEANNFSDRRVHFTRADLLKLLGWPRTGTSYERLVLAFCRWSTVFFLYENSWWENRKQSFESRGFNIIDNFELTDGRQVGGAGEQTEFPFSRFSWNEIVFGSFEAGYLKRLDFEFYLRLKHATSKRLYRFLDKRFHHNTSLKFDLHKLAFEKVGLSRGYADSGKIKEKLHPAIDELTEAGFLEPMSRAERYTKLGRGQWTVAFVRRTLKVEALARRSEPTPLEKALIDRGITPATAAELAEAFLEEHVQARLEAFDWLIQRKDKRVSKSPGGYLADSIRKGYSAPKGFEPKADRERRQAAEAEKRRQAEETKRRADEAVRTREEAERARIEGYWNLLSPSDRDRLKAEALAKADPFILDLYRKSRKDSLVAERYLKIILGTHITGLLDNPPPKTPAQGHRGPA